MGFNSGFKELSWNGVKRIYLVQNEERCSTVSNPEIKLNIS